MFDLILRPAYGPALAFLLTNYCFVSFLRPANGPTVLLPLSFSLSIQFSDQLTDQLLRRVKLNY